MKARALIGIILVLVLILSGCLLIGFTFSDTIETLEDWSFQYNDGTKDYSLFFALCDDKGKNVASEATVDIKIVNSAEEIVFEGTKNITESDFGYYTSQNEGERFLADLRIPESEISPGKAADGTIYFTVHKDGVFLFDECNCKIWYDLPIKDFSIIAENLPTEVTVNAYDGSIQSKITINSVDCEVDAGILPTVTVVISGEKTYGSGSSMHDMFNYKLYDSEGFMVKSGTIFLNSLDVGDKFRDNSLLLADITPGEQYTLKFSNYE